MSDSGSIPDASRYLGSDPRFAAWGGTNAGFPKSSTTEGLPTWGQLKDWYDNTAAGGGITPDEDTAPVLTYLSLHMGVSYDPPSSAGGDGTLNWHWAPIVVLWNPYDATLASGVYQLEVQVSPNFSTFFLANTEPSLAAKHSPADLAELQADSGAEWDERAVGPWIDDNDHSKGREKVLSFKGTDPNPDFNDGDAFRNYWPIIKATNPKYTYASGGTTPDYYNVGGKGPYVYDNTFADGTSDGFGRRYYMLKGKSNLTGRVREPNNTTATRTSVTKNDKNGPLGDGFGLRINPHNNSIDGSNPTPSKVILKFQITSSFGPGEAKVFSFRPSNPDTVSAWDPVAQPAVTLSPGVETVGSPGSVWFPAYDVLKGPTRTAHLRVYTSALNTSHFVPAIKLSIGGKTISSADQFGLYEGFVGGFMGADFGNRNDKTLDYDADGSPNGGTGTNAEEMPRLVDWWRPLYARNNFYNAGNFQNKTSETSSNLWLFGEHFFTPFLNPATTISGSANPDDVHQNIAAFSRFNFGARELDRHPLVDRWRDVQKVNNINFKGNSEGLTKLSHVRSYEDTDSSYWDNSQFTGDNGFALITYRDAGANGTFSPFTSLPIRIARRPNSNVLSLGQLQQVNLSPFFWQPAFPIGNSWAGLYTDREAIAGIHSRQIGVDKQNQTIRPPGYIPNSLSQTLTLSDNATVNVRANTMLDMSYLLNENLWDSYFLSTIQSGQQAGNPLPNSRLRFTEENATSTPSSLKDFDTSAAALQNFGALNVNSTSVEAWKALLTAFRDLELGDVKEGDEVVPVSRTLDPIGNSINFGFSGGNGSIAPSITASDIGATPTQKDYSRVTNGLRYLTDGMIAVLAQRIVDEIRLRGPFLSLADFVNRRLIPPDGSRDQNSEWFSARTNGWATGEFPSSAGPSTKDSAGRTINNVLDFISPGYDPVLGMQGVTGALQRALDLSGINGGVNDPRLGWDGNAAVTGAEVNDSLFLPRIKDSGPPAQVERGGALAADMKNRFTSDGIGGANNAYSSSTPRLTTEPTLRSHIDTEHLAGAPAGEVGQVMQGAPGFVTQGDLLAMIGPALVPRGDTFLVRTYGDATDKNGKVVARAWLEAVVQREIEPVSPAGTTGSDKYRYTDKFGRKFKVVNMRWLNPEEI